MPLIDSNDPQIWLDLYGQPAPASRKHADGTVEYFNVGPNGELTPLGKATLAYERAAMARIYGADGDRLRTALGLQPTQRICLLGCGFGWLVEQWRALGFTNLIGAEVSTHLRGRFLTEVPLTIQPLILNESGETSTSRRNIKLALGVTGNSKLDWIITEDVLPILSDQECQQLGSAARDLAANVAHWVSVKQGGFPAGHDPRLNWKTLAEWKALMGADRVVARGTAEVL